MSTRPDRTETPEGPPRERPEKPPRETPDPAPRETPEHPIDPIDKSLQAITHRSAELVADALGHLDASPDGLGVTLLAERLEIRGHTRRTIMNTLGELTIIGATRTHKPAGARRAPTMIRLTALGRAWLRGAITGPDRYPVPTLTIADTSDGPALRWTRHNPTEEVTS